MTDRNAFEPAYARRAERMRASEIRELLKIVDSPDIISFAGGIPDPKLFPVEAAAAAFARALSPCAGGPSPLQYSVSEGSPALRAWIADQMRADGVPADADNILITAGSQQALDILAKLLITEGDTVLTLSPTYLGALQAFSAYEPRYEALRLEDGDATPRSLIEAAGPHRRVKFAYVVPDFANPTGETMPLSSRRALLHLAREIDAPILEDAAYRALRFEGADLPTLQALDVAETGSLEASRVLYLGTFSKTVAPGLRLGWICAAKAVIRRLVLIIQASALNAPAINQAAMLTLVDGHHAELVAKARAHYRGKRDAMLAALQRHMPAEVAWTRPQGGMFVWATLPEGFDAARLLERSVRDIGVAFVPGGAFHPKGGGANTMRLSYSLPSPEAIEEGVRRLAGMV